MGPKRPLTLGGTRQRREPRSPSPVKGLSFQPPRTVPGLWLPDFQCAQVRRTTGEAVVHGGNQHARIDCLARRFESEVQVHGVIDSVAVGRIWRIQALKIAEI